MAVLNGYFDDFNRLIKSCADLKPKSSDEIFERTDLAIRTRANAALSTSTVLMLDMVLAESEIVRFERQMAVFLG